MSACLGRIAERNITYVDYYLKLHKLVNIAVYEPVPRAKEKLTLKLHTIPVSALKFAEFVTK